MRTMIAFTIVAVASALGSGTAALAIPLAGGQGTAAHATQIEQNSVLARRSLRTLTSRLHV